MTTHGNRCTGLKGATLTCRVRVFRQYSITCSIRHVRAPLSLSPPLAYVRKNTTATEIDDEGMERTVALTQVKSATLSIRLSLCVFCVCVCFFFLARMVDAKARPINNNNNNNKKKKRRTVENTHYRLFSSRDRDETRKKRRRSRRSTLSLFTLNVLTRRISCLPRALEGSDGMTTTTITHTHTQTQQQQHQQPSA